MTTVRRMTNTIAITISTGSGRSGLVAYGMRSDVMAVRSAQAAEDEGQRDTDDRQGLGHGEADPGGAHHRAAGLGLTRRALDDGGEDQAHADTRADGSQAVADDAERAGELQWSHEQSSFRVPLRFSRILGGRT